MYFKKNQNVGLETLFHLENRGGFPGFEGIVYARRKKVFFLLLITLCTKSKWATLLFSLLLISQPGTIPGGAQKEKFVGMYGKLGYCIFPKKESQHEHNEQSVKTAIKVHYSIKCTFPLKNT